MTKMRLMAIAILGVILIAVAASLTFYRGKIKNDGPVVTNFSLLDNQGEYFELYRLKQAQAIVLISHGDGCPILEKNIPVIQALKEDYQLLGVQFFFINANTQDDKETLASQAKKFGVDIPILIDRSQTIVASMGVERQSEAIVIDPSTWRIVYQGMIDDRLDYGIDNAQTKNNYLSLAIEGVLNGRKIETSRTQTLGCAITFERTPDPVTYNGHIAPIINKKCTYCHNERGSSPKNLQGYKQVRGWSAMIKEVVRTNRMPPWELDPNVGKFLESRTLTNEDIRLLMKWVDSGMIEGEPIAQEKFQEPPVKKFFPDKEWLGIQDIQIPPTMPKPWIYTTLVESQAEDEWISAYNFEAKNPQILQHTSILILSKCLDPADQGFEPQFRMTDGKILNNLKLDPHFKRPFVFPENIALKIPKGACVVLEQHFSPTGKAEPYSSKVSLQKYRGKSGVKEIIYDPIAIGNFEIPPFQENFDVEASIRLEQDTYLYQIGAHMHKRGQSMKLFAIPFDGREQLIFSMPHYMFQHRNIYTFEKPLLIKAGTILKATAIYNNSPSNPYNPDPSKPVLFGPNINVHEMMIMHLYRY